MVGRREEEEGGRRKANAQVSANEPVAVQQHCQTSLQQNFAESTSLWISSWGFTGCFPGTWLVFQRSTQQPISLPRLELQETGARKLAAPPVLESTSGSTSFPPVLQTQCGQSQCPGKSNTALDHVFSSPKARSGRRKAITGKVFSLFRTAQGQKGLHGSVTIISSVGRGGERLVGWHMHYPHCWQQHTHTGSQQPKGPQKQQHTSSGWEFKSRVLTITDLHVFLEQGGQNNKCGSSLIASPHSSLLEERANTIMLWFHVTKPFAINSPVLSKKPLITESSAQPTGYIWTGWTDSIKGYSKCPSLCSSLCLCTGFHAHR